MIAGAVRNLLISLPVSAGFASFDFGTGEGVKPGVFTVTIPESARNPVALVFVSGSESFATRGRKGWNAEVTVRLRGDKLSNAEAFSTLAEDVATALDREESAPFLPTGYDSTQITAQLPTVSLEDDFLQAEIKTRVRYLIPS